MAESEEWNVETRRADVATLHGLGVPENPQRLIRWCVPNDKGVVLGRAQPESDIVDRGDCAIVRRSSGGGAVLLVPDEVLWFDLLVPRHDALWETDVMRAFYWVGDVVARALMLLGYDDIAVHKDALVSQPGITSVCFAGLGPGEITVAQRKAFGISQKRTRDAALFQCSLFTRQRAQETGKILGLSEDKIALLDASTTAFPDLTRERFEAALLDSLGRITAR